MQHHQFEGTEGTIVYHRWDDGPKPDRIVVFVHGYAEHGVRYNHVAEVLAEDGAVVYAEDHIGHGRSDGERALIRDFDHVVDDLRSLVGIAQREHLGLPLVMIGHSMGGLLTARYAERFPETLAGAGFLGAVLGDWVWARSVLALPEIPQESSDPAGMSRDPTAIADYADDPLVYHGGYKRPLLEAEIEALDRFNAEIELITMPILFLHGAEDPFVPVRDSLDAAVRMPSPDKTIRVFPGARHELVNELNRAEVIEEIRRWAHRVG